MLTLSGLKKAIGRRLTSAHHASAPEAPVAQRPLELLNKGHEQGWPPALTMLDQLKSWLPRASSRTIVIVADERSDLLPWLRWSSGQQVHVLAPESLPEWDLESGGAQFSPARDLAEVNWVLRHLGPLDLLVNLRSDTAANHGEYWERIFLYLRPGGFFLIDRRAIVDGAVPDPIALVITRVGWSAHQLKAESPQRRELALSTRSAVTSVDAIAIQKRNRHLLKVRDADAGRILAVREPDLDITVLETRLGGTFHARNQTISHGFDVPEHEFPATMSYPKLHLRHYQGKIALVSNALLHTRDSILPDSFRHHLNGRLINPRIEEVSPDLARVSARYTPKRRLEGTYFHLDLENSGHFGHLMTEGVSRLWGWDAAKRAIPDLKLIFRIRYRGERMTGLEQQVLRAYGVDDDDVVPLSEPAWVESIVAATPMFHNARPHYIHPGIQAVWERLGAGLIVDGPGAGDRIFVSRRNNIGNRTCRNAEQVEALFAQNGFAIIYPEEHDVATQAAIFQRARVIAGFAGSAMFNLVYAKNPTVLILSHEAYTARNEHLIAAIVGGATHYFWSAPDVPHPAGKWSQDAYYSDWMFDFERNGADIVQVLDQVDGKT